MILKSLILCSMLILNINIIYGDEIKEICAYSNITSDSKFRPDKHKIFLKMSSKILNDHKDIFVQMPQCSIEFPEKIAHFRCIQDFSINYKIKSEYLKPGVSLDNANRIFKTMLSDLFFEEWKLQPSDTINVFKLQIFSKDEARLLISKDLKKIKFPNEILIKGASVDQNKPTFKLMLAGVASSNSKYKENQDYITIKGDVEQLFLLNNKNVKQRILEIPYIITTGDSYNTFGMLVNIELPPNYEVSSSASNIDDNHHFSKLTKARYFFHDQTGVMGLPKNVTNK